MKSIKQLLFLVVFCSFYQSSFSQVGINTSTPLSTLDVNGNVSLKVVNLPGNGSGSGGAAVLIDDGVYISISPVATDDKFQLPNPTLFPGRMYIIRNIQNAITAQLTTATGLLFPKNSTTGSAQIYMYEGNLRTVTVISDGSNWTYIN
ncbi:hypothetical protein [Flavobacterium sp.]|uniref:hypothetical protein n=1 Tax=Flavobacterium sp. TaxID=239 RepID=UPI002B4B47AC|nr:hypothetical protein [Flavobacterium sp.]HLP64168.1 hypothetical protein [Flavobacterium sp.]